MKSDPDSHDDHISRILNDPAKVTEIIQSGIKAALLKHKQAGNPVCGWCDNKVVWIPPEEIPFEVSTPGDLKEEGDIL